MILWALGVTVYLLVIVPVVIVILNGVIRPAMQIKEYADDITRFGSRFGRHLDALQGLSATHERARQARAELERYGRALERIG
jgi:hypothetical protein